MRKDNALPYNHCWFRLKDKIDLPLPVHHQLLAFVSDYQLLATASLPHRKEIAKTRAYYASLDHALWFHRDFDINEWLLYDMKSPSASNSRGFARGSIFIEDGTMVASVAQEGLMRKLVKSLLERPPYNARPTRIKSNFLILPIFLINPKEL